MNTLTVAFDESGNSKEDLLNPDQPIFTLASVYLKADEALSLLNMMPPTQAPEIKFSGQRKSSRGQAGIIKILNSDLLNRDSVAVSIYDKSFMATAKMVDVLIEPVLYSSGLDLYGGRWNLELANLWHIAIKAIIGEEQFRNLQGSFVTMMRRRQQSDVDAFYTLVSALQTLDVTESVKLHLSMLEGSREFIDDAFNGFETTLLDPAIPTFVSHCGYWTAKIEEVFEVLCDASEPLQHEAELLYQLTAPDKPAIQYDHNSQKIVFPSKAITPFTFLNSKDCPAVQVADLIAGASNYWARGVISGNRDEFWNALDASQLKEVITDAVWPTLPIIHESLEHLSSQNSELVEHVGNLLSDSTEID